MLNSNDKNIQWFKEARFGLFIHWGLYAATEGYWNGKETPGIGEWIAAKEKIETAEYEKLAEQMTCEKFDAEYIAELAKNAGMKYCVFTAKHHEGFSMFDTEYDDYSITKRSPFKKDVAREITEAMRKAGIVPCFYYSQALDFHEKNAMGNTWDNPVPELERDFREYIDGKCKHQIKELLTNYGDIGLVWMDVPNNMTREIAQELKDLVHSLQPGCLVSGRIGGGADMGDFGCLGDNQIPAGKLEGCWETAATMNGTWGYKRDDHNFKSPKEIIELLCELMSKGTNLLLNIGPKANGEIPQESIKILEEIADWYKINAEAIQGTDASPFECDFTFGCASSKKNIIYLYLFDDAKKVEICGIENTIKKVSVLGGKEVAFTQGDSLKIQLDNEADVFGKYVTVLKVELDGIPKIKTGIYQQEKEHIILPASCCNVIKNDSSYLVHNEDNDVAVEAENFNLEKGKNIAVTVAGVVENWFSVNNFIEWTFEVNDDNEYEAYLYTLTKKYSQWVGGHSVHMCVNDKKTCSAILKNDKKSRGANNKYFAETGSYIGKITLKKGINVLRLYADNINTNDTVGLRVSKLILSKN